MIVVSDTTAISTLAKCNKLVLLEALYGSVIVPTKVADELMSMKDESAKQRIREAHWIQISQPKSLEIVTAYRSDIDDGEMEAIALACELNAELLLIDDAAGRRIAKTLHLHVTGLVGIAIEAKRKGIIKKVIPLVDEFRIAGFWVSDVFYNTIKQLSNE